jgi:hypothetical protein
MLFPDSISTEDLSKLLSIKTASHLNLKQKERASDEWAEALWARKTEGKKKQKRSKHQGQKIYWWM